MLCYAVANIAANTKTDTSADKFAYPETNQHPYSCTITGSTDARAIRSPNTRAIAGPHHLSDPLSDGTTNPIAHTHADTGAHPRPICVPDDTANIVAYRVSHPCTLPSPHGCVLLRVLFAYYPMFTEQHNLLRRIRRRPLCMCLCRWIRDVGRLAWNRGEGKDGDRRVEQRPRG